MNNRLNYVDIAKGIGIILVVLGHSIPEKLGVNIVPFIYTFHMPLFFILAGFFLPADKYTIGEFAIKRAKQLLLPTLYFTIITIVIQYPIGHFELTTLQKGLPGVLWFLPTLFLSQLILMVFFKMSSQITYRAGIVCVLFLVAFFLNNKYIPYSILTSIIASAFVGIGYMLNINHIIKQNSTYGNFSKVILLFAFLTTLYKLYNVSIDMRLNVLSPYLISLATSVIGTFMVIRLSMLIEGLKMGGAILRYLGINSMIIMVIHLPARHIFEYIFQGVITNFLVYGLFKQVFVWVVCLFMAQLINNKLKFLLGK